MARPIDRHSHDSDCTRVKNILCEDARYVALGGILAVCVILPIHAVSLQILQVAGVVDPNTSYQTVFRHAAYENPWQGTYRARFLPSPTKHSCFWSAFARQINLLSTGTEQVSPALLKAQWTTINLSLVFMRELFYRRFVQELFWRQSVKLLLNCIAPRHRDVVDSRLVKVTRVVLTALLACEQLTSKYHTDMKKRMQLATTLIVQISTGLIYESGLGLRGALSARLFHQLAVSSMIWTDC